MGRPIQTVEYKGRRIPVHEYLEEEHKRLGAEIRAFQQQFAELEIALSSLLQAILNIRASNIGHAIYYSVTGFDARTDIVFNALLELISENKVILKGLSSDTILPYLDKKIGKVRNLRNAIAHGSAQNLIIRNKTYVRWSPPAFDAIRVFRKIANRGIPGLGVEDIRRGHQPIHKIIDCLDALNRIAVAMYAKDERLPDRILELEVGLMALRSLYSDSQTPAKSKDQPGSSSP